MFKIGKLTSMLLVMTVMVTVAGCGAAQKKPVPDNLPPKEQTSVGAEPDITVFMHETGEKKTMKLEAYIEGVVAGEMKNDWPVAALAAQAIIARTFTMEAIESKGGVPERGTQASTDIKEFQAYNAKAVNDNVKQAVANTRGKVITYQGQLAKTWFHASAGGITASAKEGLNYKGDEPPYIQSTTSPDELAPEDVKNWTAPFSTDRIKEAMRKVGQASDSIEKFAIKDRGQSRRATVFVVNDTIPVSAPDFRVALGATELKSTLIDSVTMEGGKVVFRGKGYGHGVGMSQWGAHKLAQDGKKPEEIISHYYRGVTIEKRWN